MGNVLSLDRQLMVMRLLVEGNSLRGISRITGVHRTAVQRLLVILGDASRKLLDERMRSLELRHLECDEIWTFVQKKQSRLTTTERDTRADIGDIYLWFAVDQHTKLAPTFVLGKRSADMARRFMMDLSSRLNMLNPHSSDPHGFILGQYQYLTQISTDGFAGYPEAVDMAFGPYAKFGTIVKQYRNARITYTPSEMVGTVRTGRRGIPKQLERTICTSHIERHNLTVRTLIKRFARLSLGFSKKLDHLAAAIALHFANYNFAWRTRYDDKSGQSGRLRPTAAMMAGVSDHVWSAEELFRCLCDLRQ